MTWKCKMCGVENQPSQNQCIGCGYALLPARLVLTNEATGKRLRMHVTTLIGNALLRTIADGEAAYASEPQFEIVKDESRGAWLLRHHGGARNPTCFNGAKIGTETPTLETGAVISIGRDHLKLTVTLEDA